jgi:hypothetical protein
VKLIVNADDFGLSSAVNEAIMRAFEMGIIDRTSAIANAPYFADACQLAIEKGFENRVGVHFNILEGRAISSKIPTFILSIRKVECLHINAMRNYSFRDAKWKPFPLNVMIKSEDSTIMDCIQLVLIHMNTCTLNGSFFEQ